MTTATDVPTIELNDGHAIPQLGFGVFQISPEDTADAVAEALRVGYRSIDTAAAYGNEAEVGEALRDSGIDRDDLFVTTKLWNSEQGAETTRPAFEKSLAALGLDYLDLYLIHWPVPSRDLHVASWQEMERLQAEGLVRSIGVSNFNRDHLDNLADHADVVPAANQIELHPGLQQAELRRVDAERGIATEAWSPLAQGELLDDETLGAIAEAHDKTVAQVILRWHLQLGNVVIPKSATPDRIAENFDLFDFELGSDEMERIAGLDAGNRTGPDPATFGGD